MRRSEVVATSANRVDGRVSVSTTSQFKPPGPLSHPRRSYLFLCPSTNSSTACVASSKTRPRPVGHVADVDARLRQHEHAGPRLRGDARGGDGRVRQCHGGMRAASGELTARKP